MLNVAIISDVRRCRTIRKILLFPANLQIANPEPNRITDVDERVASRGEFESLHNSFGTVPRHHKRG